MVDATKICGGGSADEEYNDPDRVRREYYGVSERISEIDEAEDGATAFAAAEDGVFEGDDAEDDAFGDVPAESAPEEGGSESHDGFVCEDDDSEPHHGPCGAPRSPKPSHVEIGMRGEEAAARFLRRRGYDIIARNWKCPAGEADIIAHDGETVVFIEVKTRTSFDRGMPEEAVGPKKRQRYERIAAYFLADYQRVDVPVRFDVVALLIVAPDRALVRHHINAFGAA